MSKKLILINRTEYNNKKNPLICNKLAQGTKQLAEEQFSIFQQNTSSNLQKLAIF